MTLENTTSIYGEVPTHNKFALHIVLGFITIGCLGNASAIVTIFLKQKFRKSSTAFICHQSFLDLVIGLYNFLYGFYLLHNTSVPSCNAVGSSYVLLVTVSAYNLLAIAVNEECEMQRPSMQRERNHFCVIFGITILWFTCILIQMGVAFLPKEPEYIADVGGCVFKYGTPSNHVLHILWILLVTIAIVLTMSHFLSMFCRVRYKAKSLKWALIHRSLLHDVFSSEHSNDLDPKLVQKSCHSNNLYTHLYLRRIKLLNLMVITYILCWYPLFLLTIIDGKFESPKKLYKGLTIMSWCHPTTTPIYTFLILHDMSTKDGLIRRIYSNVYPMMQFYQNQPITNEDWEEMDSGILNTHFGTPELVDDSEGQTLLHNNPDCLQEDDIYDMERNATNISVNSPIVIQQWDCSPTSPGKQRKT